jgi:hypothetical protein
VNQQLAQEALEELQGLARNVDREFYKVNNAIQDAEADIDMDAIVDEVLDSLELDGREVSCSTTPDAPDIDLDIDTEALENAIGKLVTYVTDLGAELDTLAQTSPEAPQGITLTAEEVDVITSALFAQRVEAHKMFEASEAYLTSMAVDTEELRRAHVTAQIKRGDIMNRLTGHGLTLTAKVEGDSMA